MLFTTEDVRVEMFVNTASLVVRIASLSPKMNQETEDWNAVTVELMPRRSPLNRETTPEEMVWQQMIRESTRYEVAN